MRSLWLGQLDGIIDSLNSKRLILVARPATDPFWISDNPVVMWNAFPYGILGLAERGIEIYIPISHEYALGFWCPSIELKMGQLLASRPAENVRQQVSAILQGIQAGKPVLPLAADTLTHLNSLQITYSSRFIYGPSDDFALAREIVACQPEIRDVQSLKTVGPMGQGPAPNPNMPPGLWAVFYGNLSHHMLKVTSWHEDAECLILETSICDDQPLVMLDLRRDGASLTGMRRLRIEVTGEGASRCARIAFRDAAVDKIVRLARARRSNYSAPLEG
jgi:hypothetical protein